MSLADIDRALEELSSQFNSLLAEASANPAEDYTERFRELSESTTRSSRHIAQTRGRPTSIPGCSCAADDAFHEDPRQLQQNGIAAALSVIPVQWQS